MQGVGPSLWQSLLQSQAIQRVMRYLHETTDPKRQLPDGLRWLAQPMAAGSRMSAATNSGR